MESANVAETQTQATEAATGINQSEKQFALIVYILQAVSIFIGITSIVGVIMNHVKSGSLTDPVIKSHNSWQIRTFWWMLLFLVPLVWYTYRVVKGIMRLNDGKSI